MALAVGLAFGVTRQWPVVRTPRLRPAPLDSCLRRNDERRWDNFDIAPIALECAQVQVPRGPTDYTNASSCTLKIPLTQQVPHRDTSSVLQQSSGRRLWKCSHRSQLTT